MSKNKKIDVITKIDEIVEQTLAEDNNVKTTSEEVINEVVTEKIDNVEDVTNNLTIEKDEIVESLKEENEEVDVEDNNDSLSNEDKPNETTELLNTKETVLVTRSKRLGFNDEEYYM